MATAVALSNPDPPYSSGTVRPNIPRLDNLVKRGWLNVSVRLFCIACGSTCMFFVDIVVLFRPRGMIQTTVIYQ
jgi:hypothetical protein